VSALRFNNKRRGLRQKLKVETINTITGINHQKKKSQNELMQLLNGYTQLNIKKVT
jgi:hypothetical protein